MFENRHSKPVLKLSECCSLQRVCCEPRIVAMRISVEAKNKRLRPHRIRRATCMQSATPVPQQEQSDMPIGKLPPRPMGAPHIPRTHRYKALTPSTECAIPHFDRPASLFEFLSESDFRNVLLGVEIDEAMLCCLSMSSTWTYMERS